MERHSPMHKPFPGVFSWDVHAQSSYLHNHLCFARANGLRHTLINSTTGTAELQRFLNRSVEGSSALIVGARTILSPQFLQPSEFQDFFATYLSDNDVVLPITPLQQGISVIGSFGMFVRNSAVGRAFVDTWASMDTLCAISDPETRQHKTIVYAAVLRHLFDTHNIPIQQLDTMCRMDPKKIHAFFLYNCFRLLSDGIARSEQSCKRLLLTSGILLTEEPFAINAARSGGVQAAAPEWRDAALSTLLIHAGGFNSASAHASERADIYLVRLLNLLGFEQHGDECPHRLSSPAKGTEDQKVKKGIDRWHFFSKIIMIVMLSLLLVTIGLFVVVVIKII